MSDDDRQRLFYGLPVFFIITAIIKSVVVVRANMFTQSFNFQKNKFRGLVFFPSPFCYICAEFLANYHKSK